ncbi:MAG: phage terminase small subunit P27 family [Thermodesulfobacteriota bacterium]
MNDEKTVSPPRHLSKEAKSWWTQIHNEFEIEDSAALLILTTAAEAFDRMRQAQQLLKKQGATFLDRFGQVRANPATTIERDSRAAMLNALKALNLDLEPLQERPGRPAGRK